ncbi:MAG: phosphoglycolate phosphatase [Gammaproteobacteria bacterium]|nr:phosphoglycolate phosphatase [Gammaproteobacteria bacterium]
MTKSATFPLAVKMVMLDLDGTLIHTAPDLADCANRMLADLGRAPAPVATVMTWIGNGVPRLVKRALTGEMMAEPDPALFERALKIFQQHYAAHVSDLSRPFPGVVEGLEQLKKGGYRLACITNKAEVFTLPLLKNLDLYKYFELVLSGDSLPKQKPDPLPLRHACQHFGITPDHGVLVGDSSNDVQAARAAGMPVLCVPYGYNHGHDIRESHPDAVVDSLVEVDRHLVLYAGA